MKIQRTKNAATNMLFGMILKVYQILMPFLIRTVMLIVLGIQFLGLSSLFSSVLQVLNLAELGVGSAMVFSMYRPIAQDDTATICALMRLYRAYYRIIGCVILAIGLLLIPFLPNLIFGSIPAGTNLYILYGLNLGTTVLSYWLFAYRNSVIIAHQRSDVISRIAFAADTMKYTLQLGVLLLFKNYYLFLIAALLSQMVVNVATAFVSARMFPDYTPEGKLPPGEQRRINGRIRDLFTARISGTVNLSIDTVVISAFLGLTVLAVYQNYYFIVTALMGMLLVAYESCAAGIGNALVVESEKKNKQIFQTLSFFFLWGIGWCTICLLCLFQPFIALWVGRQYLLDYSIVALICVSFFVYECIKMLCMFKDAAGIWRQDRFRPLVCALLNLALNLLTVRWLGLYGVVLSTIVSLAVVGIPWLLYNLFTTRYKTNAAQYLKRRSFDLAVLSAALAATWSICRLLPDGGVGFFLVKCVVCALLPNAICLALFCRRQEFQDLAQMALNLLPAGKFQILTRFLTEKQGNKTY